jgi:hypothetical protein
MHISALGSFRGGLMAGGARRGAGRKPVYIDLLELEKLCSLNCTDEEIAAFFSVTTRTIEKRRKQPKFADAMNRGKAKGRISIRRAQMKLLESGNGTMGVWLGKNLLGQRDTPLELSGPNGSPVQFSLQVLDAIVTHARERTGSS